MDYRELDAGGETTSAGRRDGREFDERGRRGPETDRDRRPFT
jgi:hypothetical protein